MNIKRIGVLVVFTWLLNAAPVAADAYTCEGFKSDAPVTIKLLSKKFDTIDKGKWSMGIFLLENHSEATIVLSGWKEHGYFDLWYPSVLILYYSKNGDIHEPFYGTVDSLPPTDKLEIKPNSTGTFRTNIEPDNEKGNKTYQARIVYVDRPQKLCIYSNPFPLLTPKP